MANFGQTVIQRRKELGLTQDQVAKKVKVKANYIGYLERGIRHPSQNVVEKLAGVLQMDPQELFFLANPQVKNLLGNSVVPVKALPTLARVLNDAQEQKRFSQRELNALRMINEATKSQQIVQAMSMLRGA